ncbi:uncharacterized protein METZ01_LOCUS494873 [marine metagenome]|uniref:Uncharacterized protein n=1 Tax=marine metagenome TaxID=408172 RepID=A0A383DCK0_9ZZZZ
MLMFVLHYSWQTSAIGLQKMFQAIELWRQCKISDR